MRTSIVVFLHFNTLNKISLSLKTDFQRFQFKKKVFKPTDFYLI